MEKKELPFVVGVLADLSGDLDPAEPPRPLKDRKFVEVDQDNFDDVLRRSKPRVALNVPNRLSNDNSKLSVLLTFEKMDDFEPANIAAKVPALSSLLAARKALMQMLVKMEGNDTLEQELVAILDDKSKAQKLADALGVKSKKPLPSNPPNSDPSKPELKAAQGESPAQDPSKPEVKAAEGASQTQDPSKPEEKK
jgi:type VI secretion system protein ImpB